MRVFITGATGFIGLPVTRELIAAGHRVLGMSRSNTGDVALTSAGAQVHRGSLEDLDSLRSGASGADAVIHLGFVHDFTKYQENCEVDRQAIQAIGSVLAGTNRPFIVADGLGGLTLPGQIATEDDGKLPDFPFPRVSEQTAMALLDKGVSAAVMRLPQVHDTVKQGLVTFAVAIARQKGLSAYVGDGRNGWPAAHISDVAHLYRLALEKHQPGARYHAVGEESVQLKDIAEAIGRGLKIPVVSISPEEAQKHFGWMGMFVASGLAASSAITRQKLGWNPTGPSLLTDLGNMNYSEA